jgi:hypothetical protein
MRCALPLVFALAAFAVTVQAGEGVLRPAGAQDVRTEVQVAVARLMALQEIDRMAPALEPSRVFDLAAAARRAWSREDVADLAAELEDIALEVDAAILGELVQVPHDAIGRLGEGPVATEALRGGLGQQLHRGVWMPSTEGHR